MSYNQILSSTSIARMMKLAVEYPKQQWWKKIRPDFPETLPKNWYSDSRFWETDFRFIVDVYLNNDASDETIPWEVNQATIRNGIVVFLEYLVGDMGQVVLHEKHSMADVWFQCVVLGKIFHSPENYN